MKSAQHKITAMTIWFTTAVLCASPVHAESLGKLTTEGSSMPKSEALEKARAIRNENISRIKEIEKHRNQVVAEASPKTLDGEMKQIKSALQENLQRQDFWDRVIFEIDTRFTGGDIREFLKNRLTEMAIVESTSVDSANLVKLFRYTSDVLKGSPEHKDDVFALIEGYVRTTDPANPDEPQAFLSRQDYSNGTVGVSARALSKEDAAELADQRLIEKRDNEPTSQKRKSIAQ